MAPQPQKEDLLKIGHEGFAMVDDICGPWTRISLPPPNPIPQAHHHQIHYHDHHQLYHYQHYQHQAYLYQGPQVVTVREPVMPVVHQSYLYKQQVPRVVTVKETVIDSNQAAKLYGGMVIVEYGKRKPANRGS